MTLVGAAAGAAGGRKAMKEKTITVSHEVSPEYGKCSFGGDFWGEEVCKYHAIRTQTHGNKAPPEYRKPKCLLFNCWLDEPYKKCEMCRKACAAAMQTARTINRLATIWSRPPVQSMAAPCMKRRRAGAMWRKGGIRNEVDSDYRCHKVDCCVRCNLHFCLCDKGWKIPLVSSHPCIPDLSGVMAI